MERNHISNMMQGDEVVLSVYISMIWIAASLLASALNPSIDAFRNVVYISLMALFASFSQALPENGIIAQWVYGEQLIRRVSDASWQNGITAWQRWENAVLRRAK